MSVIDKVRREREDLARVLKEHPGIRKIVEDLYPDSAHFIYELLQNAEDTGATDAQFILSKSGLTFEHNGRPFEPKDIYAITDIGEGTKANDNDKIGRFGVGFKAVFAYSESPHIWSSSFSFKITDLVLPSQLVSNSALGKKTRFEFPFNNPKKSASKAYDEIHAGLKELAKTTLLFLSHLVSIRWQNAAGESGEILRFKHAENHFEVIKQTDGKTSSSSHFLKFDQPVALAGLEKQRVAIVYDLGFQPQEQEFDPKKPLSTQFKIIPATPGLVAVFFPAKKETSGLRFHLHAPFVPELSRASIKETNANKPLFKQLATLAAASLHQIRKLGLLTVDFLAVLPNNSDSLPEFYQPIRNDIFQEFKRSALTPTRSGTHAQSNKLVRGTTKIADVLSDEDLSLLTGFAPPLWAANPRQNNQREDKFLDSLDIEDWKWSELANAISDLDEDARDNVEGWISRKDDIWIMRFYALLGEASDTHNEYIDVSDLKIVRVDSFHGVKHVIPQHAYFPLNEQHAYFPLNEDVSMPEVYFVKKSVYLTDSTQKQNKFSELFLKKIGVVPFNERAAIERNLKRYHKSLDQIPSSYFLDIRNYVAYWKKNPVDVGLFTDHSFLLGYAEDKSVIYSKPSQVCVDAPYIDTGLSELTSIHKKYVLSAEYRNKLNDSQCKDFVEFIKATGVMYCLKIDRVNIRHHPDVSRFDRECNWGRDTSTGTNVDYSISGLDSYLKTKSIAASRLVWQAIIGAAAEVSKARYSPNRQHQIRQYDSQLVYYLKKTAWIPDISGTFCMPQDIEMRELRNDFPYDDKNGLLSAIGFGTCAKEQNEEKKAKNELAQSLDFQSSEEAEKAAKLVKLMAEHGCSLDEELAKYEKVNLPNKSSPNPERRTGKIADEVRQTPAKTTVIRSRSINPDYFEAQGTARTYLEDQYTEDGEIFCQLCQAPQPVVLNGETYFEAVDCISGLNAHHEQNNLALCPNHAAMYKNSGLTPDTIQSAILGCEGQKIPLNLAGNNIELYFTQQHLGDLRAVLDAREIIGDRVEDEL